MIGVEEKSGDANESANKKRMASMKQVYQLQKQMTAYLKKNPMISGTSWEEEIQRMLYTLRSGVPIAT